MSSQPERVTQADLSRLQSASPQPSQSETPPVVERLSTALLDRFWQRMSEIYGHRWVSSYGAVPSDTWARGLAGFTGEQIARGLAACLKTTEEWPPSLPAFRDRCLTVQNVPEPETAWEDALAIARRWKSPRECLHPAIWHALSQIGDYSHLNTDVLEKRFRRNYEQAARMTEFTPIPQPLPRPEDVRTNYDPVLVAAKRDEALAKIDAMFGRRAQA